MTRKGPLYVSNGFVIGHRQDDHLGSFYLHQFEVIRRASFFERLAWMFFGRPPALKGDQQ